MDFELFASATTFIPNKSDPVVTVKQGILRGSIEELYDGSSYYSFKGIPYAQPPVGTLRFKAPLPPRAWKGVYDATKHGPVCPQFNIFTKKIVDGNEDCLYLNVYTKSLRCGPKTPVIVFIHGGFFMSGSGNSNTYGPKYMLQHNIVLVTFNYRLEVLGFLCLDTPEVPGNAGVKDQVAALKWVRDNIAQFDGDPDNITLFGESVGASAVTYHMLSPLSKGLFHKAIVQSGTCLHDWAQEKDGRDRAFRVGNALGKETKDAGDLLNFLQSVPSTSLAGVTFMTLTEDEIYRGLKMHFVPVVEKQFDNIEFFINDEPIKMILANKLSNIPLMVGYNSNEGIIILKEILMDVDYFNEHPSCKMPREIVHSVSKEELEDIGRRVKKYYMGNRNVTKYDFQQVCDCGSDLEMNYNIHRFLHFASLSNKSIYLYKFNCDTDLNFIKKFTKLTNLEGASHSDEQFYLFSSTLAEEIYKQRDDLKELVRSVTKLWTDFAIYGDPTPNDSADVKWLPYTRVHKEYMNIDWKFSIGQNPDGDRIEFWNKLYREAGLPCITKSTL